MAAVTVCVGLVVLGTGRLPSIGWWPGLGAVVDASVLRRLTGRRA